MKTQTTIQCPAKVNLSLDVVGRREDGYHNLETIMHTVRLYDTLTIICEDSGETTVSITANSDSIPKDGSNLCAKAARIFFEEIGFSAKVSIHIEKNIPVGAGLGGGSSNAAGTLTALNGIFKNPLSKSKLAGISKAVGADVPFFIYGGCMLAQGIGEILSPLPALKNVTFLIAKPAFGVSTPWVYKNLNLNTDTHHPDTKSVIAALESGNINSLAKYAGNTLEAVTSAKYPDIEKYKCIMKAHGAAYALMSGSGSSVFGIFTNPQKAKKAFSELKALTKQVYLA